MTNREPCPCGRCPNERQNATCRKKCKEYKDWSHRMKLRGFAKTFKEDWKVEYPRS